MAIPRLELDRPFTYLLPEGRVPEPGFLVSVPFHGRTVRGYVLGPAARVPDRVVPVRRVLSKGPLFRAPDLLLYRALAERFVVPLATVIERAHPPRVAGEEGRPIERPPPPVTDWGPGTLSAYAKGPALLEACRSGSGAFVVRPLPDEEAATCLDAVAACVEGGRDAIVLVPEAEPVPHTARAVADATGPAGLLFLGGDDRQRYRAWLDLLGGRFAVVAGTRAAVYAPVRRLGLVWVHRDAHPGHREERTPAHHVRDVALIRARVEGAVCVLAGLAPGADAAALLDRGGATEVRAPRAREREAAPLVEVAAPDREDRSPRLASALGRARSAVLLVSRRGYGVARVCRTCGRPARCARCGGPIVVRRRSPACAVCHAVGACENCGGTRFGVERSGTERIEEWARHVSSSTVRRVEEGADAVPPGHGIVVGTAAEVKDFGPRRVDVVAVLDADRARGRPGLAGPEQVLATWMEAAAWAGPRADGGRVLVHTREGGDPAVQSLVRWDPFHLHRAERARRAAAGFPPLHPVFRVLGTDGLPERLEALAPRNLLVTGAGDQTVCLVTLEPGSVPAFRAAVVALVDEGIATRVEPEPQL